MYVLQTIITRIFFHHRKFKQKPFESLSHANRCTIGDFWKCFQLIIWLRNNTVLLSLKKKIQKRINKNRLLCCYSIVPQMHWLKKIFCKLKTVWVWVIYFKGDPFLQVLHSQFIKRVRKCKYHKTNENTIVCKISTHSG